MWWKMVKVISLAVMLSACTTSNTLKPVLGDESYTPIGWVRNIVTTIQKSAKIETTRISTNPVGLVVFST